MRHRRSFRCLKTDGQIICLGPNIKYIPGTYWDFWDHFVPITDLSLAEMLRLKGFDIELRVARFLPYSMSTGSTPPLFLVKLYLQLPVFGHCLANSSWLSAKRETRSHRLTPPNRDTENFVVLHARQGAGGGSPLPN
jgi:hypothetical protein